MCSIYFLLLQTPNWTSDLVPATAQTYDWPWVPSVQVLVWTWVQNQTTAALDESRTRPFLPRGPMVWKSRCGNDMRVCEWACDIWFYGVSELVEWETTHHSISTGSQQVSCLVTCDMWQWCCLTLTAALSQGVSSNKQEESHQNWA